ncbi:hypothetical protein K2D_02850 [Planctomycetes bacterium K2D]|nr:hypothetical protein K2D_02850 [Planctomycetes bacterium K2D]
MSASKGPFWTPGRMCMAPPNPRGGGLYLNTPLRRCLAEPWAVALGGSGYQSSHRGLAPTAQIQRGGWVQTGAFGESVGAISPGSFQLRRIGPALFVIANVVLPASGKDLTKASRRRFTLASCPPLSPAAATFC